MKRTAKKSIKHTFFKYCDECGERFQPNSKGQMICNECKTKSRAKRSKK